MTSGMRTWVLVLILLAYGTAVAHPTQMAHVTLTDAGTTVDSVIRINAFDLAEAIGMPALADARGHAVPRVVRDARDTVAEYVLRELAVGHARRQPCPGTPGRLTARAQFIEVEVRWTCPEGAAGLWVESRLLHRIDPAARTLVLLLDEGRQALLDRTGPTLILREPPSPGDVVLRYVQAGIGHIFIGYDHIAFLVGVVLWGRRAWPLVTAVTAFTLGHSVTLALAVLDVVRIPAAFVEAAIAASIVYVAVENAFVRDLDRRWRVTALLGLIHGLGFASVLREFGLPADAVVPALAAFNVGVEIGQLAIVAAAMLALFGLDRVVGRPPAAARAPIVVAIGSIVIGTLGAYWFVLRIGGMGLAG
ncbi:MAG: HupE/UreJ family protein [Gammaproteobacteria bacterium]